MFVLKVISSILSFVFYLALSIPLIFTTFVLYRVVVEQRIDSHYSHFKTFNEKYTFQKRTRNEKYLVLVGAETINLAETTRMLLVADYMTEHYSDEVDVKFFHYGGAGGYKYEHLIHESPYEVFKLQPEWKTYEEIDHLYQVDRGEIIDDLIDPGIFEKRIESELELYQQLRPNLILTGFVLSAKVSAQISNIPYFITMPIVYLDLDFYLFRHFPIVPSSFSHMATYEVNRFLVYFMRKISYLANLYKRTSIKFEVFPKVRNFLNVIEGDITLVTEVPETIGWSQEELNGIYGEGYVFVGSLFARISKPIPEDLQLLINETQSKGEKILYFAMGSSGKRGMVLNILRSLDQKFKEGGLSDIGLVISPTLRIIDSKSSDTADDDLLRNLDKRIYLTQPNLPADKINEICDLGIIHGGQGTVQSAVSGAMPFVGVPCQAEQKVNIEHVVSHGSAMIASKSGAEHSGAEVLEKLEWILGHEHIFRTKAKELQLVFLKYDAPKTICDLIMNEIRE